jgi:hypothetical protein
VTVGDPDPGATGEPALVPEAITGWRMWRLQRGPDGGLELLSLGTAQAWSARAPIRARCERSLFPSDPPHPVPERSCSCGIYAAADYRQLRASGIGRWGSPAVLGTVSMWGRVVEHAEGYRAELAYPSRVLLACGRCVAAGRTPVPDFVLELGDTLIPVCRAHARHASGRPVRRSPAEIQAELCSRYAVDPLPLEAVRVPLRSRLPDPVRALLDQAGAEARALTRSWVGWVGALALALLLWWSCHW